MRRLAIYSIVSFCQFRGVIHCQNFVLSFDFGICLSFSQFAQNMHLYLLAFDGTCPSIRLSSYALGQLAVAQMM